MKLQHCTSLRGELTVPGDKSISHRAVMFGALAEGTTEVTNFLQGADCLSTIDCFRRLGVSIENTPEKIRIHGKGLHGLNKPSSYLDTGNSGTTTRLISGILAGQSFSSELTGDASIQTRPMKRIIEPLSMMGADIVSVRGNGCAPLRISPAPLHAIHYHSKVSSAQVKSAVLLAGLYAEGETQITEPSVSRNHTELMLAGFGADLASSANTTLLRPVNTLHAQKIQIPGDISSAAYFIAAGLIVPESELLIKNVGINPTRDGILQVCRSMGADITLLNMREHGKEPAADILVRHSRLKAVNIEGDIIPALIDELPIIAVMACFAEGTTIIKDAAELKVKESNRIDTVVSNLSRMGAHITSTEDGMIIGGGHPLHGAVIDSYGDHRIAMSFAVAALAAEGITEIKDSKCIEISYPDFFHDLRQLGVDI